MCDEDEDKVKCSRCDKTEEAGNLINGICVPCHEVDTTPTSKECDQCDELATHNICGTNLCENCLEHWAS